jgi:hypothetical protein
MRKQVCETKDVLRRQVVPGVRDEQSLRRTPRGVLPRSDQIARVSHVFRSNDVPVQCHSVVAMR